MFLLATQNSAKRATSPPQDAILPHTEATLSCGHSTRYPGYWMAALSSSRALGYAGEVTSGMISRRQAIACAAAAVVSPLRAGPTRKIGGLKIESVNVISQQPEFYHGWPTVGTDSHGNLLVVCSGGREAHICPFGRVEMIRSSDGGRTWSWPEVILDTPIDDR